MKHHEKLLFLETCLENGMEVKEALQDCKMIQAMLEMRKTYVLAAPHTRMTARGYLRKKTSFSEYIEKAVEGRAHGAFA